MMFWDISRGPPAPELKQMSKCGKGLIPTGILQRRATRWGGNGMSFEARDIYLLTVWSWVSHLTWWGDLDKMGIIMITLHFRCWIKVYESILVNCWTSLKCCISKSVFITLLLTASLAEYSFNKYLLGKKLINWFVCLGFQNFFLHLFLYVHKIKNL